MSTLRSLIASTLARPVPPEITAMAEHVRAGHDNVLAVLAYGSCLRGVAATDSLIDLYVLTRDLKGVSANVVSQIGCRLAPPNVYYAEYDHEGRRYRAKYAALPLDLFTRWMTKGNPYFWARFSQPSGLVFAADEDSRTRVMEACAAAATTMYAHALGIPLLRHSGDVLDIWAAGFGATYRTELRAESGRHRAAHLVESNAGHYRDLAEALRGTPPQPANWRVKTVTGKLWAAIRLIKASFTFTGGADYIAWKIERHTGHKIALTDWQRRHPVIAGLLMLPRLLASRAVR